MPEREKEPKEKIVYKERTLGEDLPPPKKVKEYKTKLRVRWKRFARAIVKGYDLGDAAEFAGYKASPEQLRNRGWQLLRRPEIQDEIERLEQMADKEIVEGDMIPDANEVTMHVAEIMRNPEIEAKDRLTAANLIAKLHGYHAPTKQQHNVHSEHDYKIQFVRGGDDGQKQIIDVTDVGKIEEAANKSEQLEEKQKEGQDESENPFLDIEDQDATDTND